ncbi:transglycosylase, partial [Gordonia desulfuricans]|nr:transglycosylase [Gordonia desulfuricans]
TTPLRKAAPTPAPSTPQQPATGLEQTPDATSTQEALDQLGEAGVSPEVQGLLKAAQSSGYQLTPDQLRLFNDNKGLIPLP